MKKQSVAALLLFLLIPLVSAAGGILFSLINPEMAAGHPNYVRNYQLLNLLRLLCLWTSFAGVAALWVLVCVLVIRSKKRSYLCFCLRVGALGFRRAGDLERPDGKRDRQLYAVHKQDELACASRLRSFELRSYIGARVQAMVLKSALMIRYEAATTGVSVAQIIDIQNASAGMWAFGEDSSDVPCGPSLPASAYRLSHGGPCGSEGGIAQGRLNHDFKWSRHPSPV